MLILPELDIWSRFHSDKCEYIGTFEDDAILSEDFLIQINAMMHCATGVDIYWLCATVGWGWYAPPKCALGMIYSKKILHKLWNDLRPGGKYILQWSREWECRFDLVLSDYVRDKKLVAFSGKILPHTDVFNTTHKEIPCLDVKL